MSERGNGSIGFAGIMLMIVGVLNVIYGIAAIGDSSFFVHNTKYIVSGLNTWGWPRCSSACFRSWPRCRSGRAAKFRPFFGIGVAGLSMIGALLSLPRTRSGRWRCSPSTS